jgi:hypothetical protein
MCWTPPYTRHKTKTNKTKNTPQYVLDTTIHKTQDEDKQNRKYNTIFVGHHHTQDTRRRQTKHKTQHNMCWTLRHEPSYKQLEVKTNRTSFVCRNRNIVIDCQVENKIKKKRLFAVVFKILRKFLDCVCILYLSTVV